MLNVKTLTDTMSRMPLPQLQQYAALHKNDPYIVTLALSIANQKKQMLAGKAGQAGMMPQPKVVDQQISDMAAVDPMGNVTGAQPLPEDTGIGKLPAQNMQRMAGGGIVAFEEGGDVPGYFDGNFFGDTYTTDPAEMQRRKLLAQQRAQTQAQTQKPPVGIINANSLVNAPTQADIDSRKAAAQTILNESPEDYAARKVAELEAQGGKKLSPDARNMAMSQFVKDKITGQIKRGEASFTKDSQLPAPATTYAGVKALPGMTPPGMPPLTTAQTTGAPPPAAEDDYMAGINKLLKSSQTGGSGRYDVTAPQLANATPKDMADRLAAAMGPNPTESPLAGQQTELNKANVASRQKYADDLAEQFKNQGEAFKGTLEKLTAKEARVKTMEDNQLGMSMFEAGLAMMAGDSPYAMVNIGKGAQVGTKKYMEIQEKVEGARDKIDDAKMKIEEFRRNEANMNARELRLAKKDVDDAVSAGAQASLNLMREQYGLKHAEGLAFVSNSYALDRFNIEQKTSYAQMGNQRDIAAMQNRTHLGLAALEAKYKRDNPSAGSLGFYKQLATNPEAIKGMKLYSESLGPEAKGEEAILLDWSKKTPIEKEFERKKDPMGSAVKDRKLQERLLQGSVSDKPAGKVLD
jgi:hypothetical protein